MSNDNEQLSMFNKHKDEQKNNHVTVLGMTFKNDQERREYFTEELRKKLPELKNIEGFPVGEDEDILALSDPPYYTACPNPWINDFIKKWVTEKSELDSTLQMKKKPPFTADISEGKSHPIYMAHSYHTKVPHRAIIRYLLHYTQPGDIIFDGFAGTGMTGIASTLCDDEEELKALGYNVIGDEIYDDMNKLVSKKGRRYSILNDLSPIATFISKNFNNELDKDTFEKEIYQILTELKNEFGWMFTTFHNDKEAEVNNIIWSDVFTCPNCTQELIYWDIAIDIEKNNMNSTFICTNCASELNKKKLERKYETVYDIDLGKTVEKAKMTPVQINYTFNGVNLSKTPDKTDLYKLKKINDLEVNCNLPFYKLPNGINTSQPIKSHGFTHVHHFFTRRNNIILGQFYKKIKNLPFRDTALFLLTSSLTNLSYLYRWRANGKGGATSGTLYVCSTPQENNPFKQLNRKLNDILKILNQEQSAAITTQSLTNLEIEEESIDYVFTDPPFGSNLMYSELNLLWEAWLKVLSDNTNEAIINKVQRKRLPEYQKLMETCFKNYYKVLKPGKWMTVEFSNSQSSVWNAIQEAIQRSGFIIANVSTLDKKQGSFKAVTSTTAVKQDLIISAYKPNKEMISNMSSYHKTQKSAWAFVKQHLEKLPVFIGKKGDADIIIERTPRVLFDRMVAYHVQNGFQVPLSSAEFQEGISQHFPMRDGMAFLENQVAEYDKKRILVKEFTQTSLFVSDENSAIEWIRQQLMQKPQTRQDLHPSFMKEIQHIDKHELLPELDQLLEQNFLQYDGGSAVPDQVASYLKQNYKDLRGTDNNNTEMKNKAMNRWYVPNPNKQADLEKLREKSLLREFEAYVEEVSNSRKKLKQFRTEAIRAGFKKAWSDKDYQKIVDVGERLPEKVIQEDDKLLMYFDNAQIRLGL
ncbi:DNA methyltransferase [Alkalibacillus haloalkaliphilus]|uniref:DNA methylase n=1 Tax=Alkalibacillus haloalkaliphilus TaxID=94136 RepID=A0A511W6W9_9BACI|nr:DNA methyltransferase [Alkalibacillus haloalkaliphilus]GEN46747.1 DNA methylase [Alkalibacillus haloalkaliphilus]